MTALAGPQMTVIRHSKEKGQACPALSVERKTTIPTAESCGGLPLQTAGETSESGHFGNSLGFIVGVLAEDYKALQDRGDREVLLCGQLCPLSMCQQHWCGVSLETCDGLWLACLAHNIHSLDTDHTNKLMRSRVIILSAIVVLFS